MRGRGWLRLMPGNPTLRLSGGYSLRLLTAMEVLEARREAEEFSSEDRERALCSNACLLSKALMRRGKPVYASGREMLEKKTVREIQALAKAWAEFDRENNPGLTLPWREADILKKVWGTHRRSVSAGACSKPSAHCRRRRGQGR